MRINAIPTFLAAILMPLWCACSQRELCYDHSHTLDVEVVFDWSMEPDANPETMVVWAFPADGSQGLRTEFSMRTRDGAHHIKLEPGTYHLLTYNGATDLNIEWGSTLGNIRLTTYEVGVLEPLNRSENAPRPAGSESQPTRAESNHIFRHLIEEPLTVERAHIKEGKKQTVVFTPVRASAVWNITIEEVENIPPEVAVSGVVTGVAEHYHLTQGSPGGEAVTVPFSLHADTKANEETYRGSVVLFGDAAPHDVPHRLRIYTDLNYYFDYDITDQVHSAPDPLNVDIVVKGMKIPANESGLSPGVDGWGHAETYDIPM